MTSETNESTVTASVKYKKSVKRKTSTRSKGKGKRSKGVDESVERCQARKIRRAVNMLRWMYSWYHRICAGIHDDDDWNKYPEHDVKYMCPLCQ